MAFAEVCLLVLKSTRESVVGVELNPQLDDIRVPARPPALDVDVKHHNLVLSNLLCCSLFVALLPIFVVALINGRTGLRVLLLGNKSLVGGSLERAMKVLFSGRAVLTRP